MSRSAAERPEPTHQRKAAIVHGGAKDHSGDVRVEPIRDFDLNRTIFQTLEGRLARYVARTRVAKRVDWDPAASSAVDSAYAELRASGDDPPIAPELLRFMVEECDFDVEHADGSFLDHLYFCMEYSGRHYPQRSSIVMLLHSILGTGTNTFAMPAEKMPALRALMTPFEWTHTEAFPSILRLLYAGGLRSDLRANLGRLGSMESIGFHRVIDNAAITMGSEDFWIALNYQLIHLVDFLPVANWSAHRSDTAFIIFRDLHDLLVRAERLEATVRYDAATGPRVLPGERHGLGSWLTTRIPVGAGEKMAGKAVERFSERIGHSQAYSIVWSD